MKSQNLSQFESDFFSSTLYHHMGGDGPISDLVDKFYYKVLFDKLLRGAFYKSDMHRVRQQQKDYFSCLFGGPEAVYNGKDVQEVHRHLAITEEQFDHFSRHLEQILLDQGKPKEVVRDVLMLVECEKSKIVTSSR